MTTESESIEHRIHKEYDRVYQLLGQNPTILFLGRKEMYEFRQFVSNLPVKHNEDEIEMFLGMTIRFLGHKLSHLEAAF